jgi:2-C-methyl-D-erythritol 4-phosphate cytidylyltransferase
LRAIVARGSLPANAEFCELIIAARREEYGPVQAVIDSLPPHEFAPLNIRIVEGGESRQESVANAAGSASGDFLLVHDAARPLLSAELVFQVCQAALRDGAAILAVPVSDTVKSSTLTGGKIVIENTLDRGFIWLAQTPQVFRRAVLLTALASAAADSFSGTDCASLVERIGYPVTIVPGELRNFKVTYAADLERAAMLLRE